MTTINSAGYYNTSRGLLHRLIWEERYGPIPPKMEINHKDGNKLNNDLDNLELVTHQQNAIHARRILHVKGGSAPGEKNGRAKLNWEQVEEIRKLYKDGFTQAKLATQFGVAHQMIGRIVRLEAWKEGANHSCAYRDNGGIQ